MRRTMWAVLLLLPVISLAQTPPSGTQIDPSIGDGAAQCAEAKMELADLPHHEPTSIASTNIDISYYHLALSIDLLNRIVAGTVRIEGTVVGSSMSVLTLDLANGMAVSAVKLPNATPLVFAHPGAALNITLPAPVGIGGAVAVDVTYSGTPIQGGFGNFVFGIRPDDDLLAWSLSEPYGAREWWPCKDHPSDKADSVRVTVTVPSQYRVGSQGLLEGETSGGGMTTYDWVSRYPISNYLVSVAVGEYVRYQSVYTRSPGLTALYGVLSMPLDNLVYNDGSSALFANWANVGDDLDVFENWFGPYPFADEKYGHSECTFGGGMEHQTMGSLGGSTPGLVAHELAHQWFGDNISPKTWPHLWLNEGFATYAEIIYFEERAATYPGTAATLIASRYTSALDAVGTLVLEDTTSVSNMFNGNRVYAKGGVVLHMLRYVVGDADFKDILKTYAADPAVHYGVATTSDFQRVAETVSGMDLDVFFSQWVTTGNGYPRYRAYNFSQPYLGVYKVWVTLEQYQQPGSNPGQSNISVFVMPVVIAVQTTGGEQRFTVQNDQRRQTFELTVAAQPTSVAIDPDNKILRGSIATAVADRAPTFLTVTSLLPNPARHSFTFQYVVDRDGALDVDVFDIAGRRVLSRPAKSVVAGSGAETIDASSLAAGVYFIRVRAGQEQATRKFVVVR